MASFDWSKLAGPVIEFGATGLGTIFAGPIGGALAGAAGKALAAKLGVEPTPDAVEAAIITNPEQAKVAIAEVESQTAEMTAMYESMKVQSMETGQTMRAEIAAAGELEPGFWRTTALVMNTIWRPLYAIEGLFECMIFVSLLAGVMWSVFFSPDPERANASLDALAKVVGILQPLLLIYLPARFAIIGYQMHLRTSEKKATVNAAVGGLDPAMLTGLVAALIPSITKAVKK